MGKTSKNQDDQINELNSTIKTRIAPSSIHGVGVFAIMDIRKGERCYCVPVKELNRWYSVPWGSLNKLFPEVRELIMAQWPSIVNGSHFLSPNYTAWPILFMNHSSTPNYSNLTDLALEDIEAGQELTEDYCLMENAEKAFPTLCIKTNV